MYLNSVRMVWISFHLAEIINYRNRTILTRVWTSGSCVKKESDIDLSPRVADTHDTTISWVQIVSGLKSEFLS